MRIAFFLLASSVLFGQGTVPTVGTWTRISTPGGMGSASGYTTGYDKTEYVSSLTSHCVWGLLKIPGAFSSEGNQANNCYSYSNNFWVSLTAGSEWLNAHNGNAGHANSAYAYMPDRDAFAYYSGDGSGSNVAQKFAMNFWWYDVAGLSGHNKELLSAPWLPNSTAINSMVYDQNSLKLVLWPAYDASSTQATAVIDPATNLVTLYSTAQTGIQPSGGNFSNLVYNSTDHKIYKWGGGSATLYQFDVPTHTWTALTTTCAGIACVGTSPPTRHYAGMSYSSTDHIILMAGGLNGAETIAYSDTWVLDTTALTWTQQAPAANYGASNSVGSPTFDKLTYDPDSNVFLLIPSGSSLPWVFPYSTGLGYGRSTPTYTPTAGGLNRISPTSNSQSWAYSPSLAASGSTIYAGWIETFSPSDSTSCSNGSFHPFVQSTVSGSWTGLPTGSQATACLAMDSEASGNTVANNMKVGVVGGTPWALWDKYNSSSVPYAGYAKFWTGSAWSGGAIGCFEHAGACVSGTSPQRIQDIVDNASTATVAVTEWDVAQFTPESYLFVAAWNGSSWVKQGSTRLNIAAAGSGTRAMSAALASDGTNPAACWTEEKRGTTSRQSNMTQLPQANCSLYNGSTWTRFGSAALNHDASTYAFDITMTYVGGSFYVAWGERTESGSPKLWLCQWTGSACTFITGAALNITVGSWVTHPTLSNDGTNVIIAWEEQATAGAKTFGHVAKWNGGSLTALGSTIAADTSSGSIQGFSVINVASAPTAIWTENLFGSYSQTYVKQWNGSTWAAINAPSGGATTVITGPAKSTGRAVAR